MVKDLEVMLDEVAKKEINFTKPLQDSIDVISNATQLGFGTETDPDGNKWAKLAESTKKRKKKSPRDSRR